MSRILVFEFTYYNVPLCIVLFNRCTNIGIILFAYIEINLEMTAAKAVGLITGYLLRNNIEIVSNELCTAANIIFIESIEFRK